MRGTAERYRTRTPGSFPCVGRRVWITGDAIVALDPIPNPLGSMSRTLLLLGLGLSLCLTPLSTAAAGLPIFPRSVMWVLLYAQAQQVDATGRRNVLLNRQQALVQRSIVPAPRTDAFGECFCRRWPSNRARLSA